MVGKYQIINTPDRVINQIQQNTATILNPLSGNPLVSGQVLSDIQLLTGSNTVNHKLGRNLLGWFIVRQRGPASVYDTQDSNEMQNLTLLLTSSANVLVDLYVF